MHATFVYPLKTSKAYGFLMFSEGREKRVHWEQMG